MSERSPLTGRPRPLSSAGKAGLLVGGALLVASLLTQGDQEAARHTQRPLVKPSERRSPQGIPTGELSAGKRSAHAFVRGYLRVVSGATPPSALHPLSIRLRRRPELVLPRPTASREPPKLVSLEVVVQAPDLLLATATLGAGGATYPFTFNLSPESGRWVVTVVGAD